MVSILNPLSLHGYGYVEEISKRHDNLYVKIHVIDIKDNGEPDEIFFDCQVQDLTLINFLLKIKPLVTSEAFIRLEFEARYLGSIEKYIDQPSQANIVTMEAQLVSIKNCTADDVKLCVCSNEASSNADDFLSLIV
ncbi:MAG: hypothetical protein K0S08_681 [Gammaproteobacteria bacterium]|nr:hypothetical protein [Gammaproteobacteria bacterium]